MTSNQIASSALLEAIPASCRTPEQVARWDDGSESTTYKLLRTLRNLEELKPCNDRMAIWRDNNTLTYVTTNGNHGFPHLEKICLSLRFYDNGPALNIVGKTDNSVAETAVFFLGLKRLTGNTSSPLFFGSYFKIGFNFRAAGSQCLKHILEEVPSREPELRNLTLSAKQSIAMATRSHPVRLQLDHCLFEDGGSAFVEMLENRQSSFGALAFRWNTGLTDENLKRLLQVDTISHLELPLLNDALALLPFSAKVDHLIYSISPFSLLEESIGIQSLSIMTNKLSLLIKLGSSRRFPAEFMCAFWRCIADLGHFVELQISCASIGDLGLAIPDCVVQEIIRAALANSKLRVLDVSDFGDPIEWNANVGTLLQSLKDHKELRFLKLTAYSHDFGDDYSNLRELLTHNRNITVTDKDGFIHSNGSSITELYSLNRFFRGSANFVVQPPSVRSPLVATALMKVASTDFQRSAFLLSHHVDALCDLVQFARFDDDGSRRKRKERIQPPRASKKTTRSFA